MSCDGLRTIAHATNQAVASKTISSNGEYWTSTSYVPYNLFGMARRARVDDRTERVAARNIVTVDDGRLCC